MALVDPPPELAPIASSNGQASFDYTNWFFQVWSVLHAQPQVIGSLTLTAQSASIATAPIPLPALANGWYRISGYARKTTIDGVASSLALTFGWTENSVSLTKTFPANATDATTAVNTDALTVQVGQNTSLTYATTYTSNTPTAMKYRLQIVVEYLPSPP